MMQQVDDTGDDLGLDDDELGEAEERMGEEPEVGGAGLDDEDDQTV